MAAITNTTSKYVRDFEALFVPIKRGELCSKALAQGLSDSQFRSLAWSYFLGCLPKQHDQWLDGCKKNRQLYEEIKTKHLAAKLTDDTSQPSPVSPSLQETTRTSELDADKKQRDVSHEDEGPSDSKIRNKDLEDEQQYMKAAKQCDHKNVSRTIERDVVRTFPDMEFFRRTEMQAILKDVLFNFACENPNLSYKQGMHELLAILLYTLHTDAQNCLINYEGGYANETIATLLDLKYLEHDVFRLFSALMKSIETWYQNDDPVSVVSESKGVDTATRFNKSGRSSQTGSFLGVKLNQISENIVKKYDLELFNHLEALQIAPQIYGIRWCRLLFSREFEFFDLLTIWDAIICDEITMSLTEYIFASMLITIRSELVNGDYTDCLNNLMRYQFKDVQYVIKLALHLRDPKNNPRPRAPKSMGSKRHNQSSNYDSYPSETHSYTSLATKLSQQYISGAKQQKPKDNNQMFPSSTTNQPSYSSRMNNPSTIDSRDSRKIFMTPKPLANERQRSDHQFGYLTGSTSADQRFSSQVTGRSSGQGVISSTNKFLPNINKLVSSIGQNIHDKTTSQQSQQSNIKAIRHQQRTSSSFRHAATTNDPQQYHYRSSNELMLLTANPIKEYEMREMQSSSSGSTQGQTSRFPIGNIRDSDSRNVLNVSNESNEDLHSIVDYCWRLLSEQIESLQRCLVAGGQDSEDEIFVALAQLKKIRDVLKGSLRIC